MTMFARNIILTSALCCVCTAQRIPGLPGSPWSGFTEDEMTMLLATKRRRLPSTPERVLTNPERQDLESKKWTEECQERDLTTIPDYLELKSKIEGIIKVFNDQDRSRIADVDAEDRRHTQMISRRKEAYAKKKNELEVDRARKKNYVDIYDMDVRFGNNGRKCLIANLMVDPFFKRRHPDGDDALIHAKMKVDRDYDAYQRDLPGLEKELDDYEPFQEPVLQHLVPRDPVVPKKQTIKFTFIDLWIGYNPKNLKNGWGFNKPRWYNAKNRRSTYRKVECIEFWEVHSGKPDDNTSVSKLMTIHYAPKEEDKVLNATTPLLTSSKVDNEKTTVDQVQAVTLSCEGYTLTEAAKTKRKPFRKGHEMFKLHSENGWGGKAAKTKEKRDEQILSPFDAKVLSGHLYFSGTEDDTRLLSEYFGSEDFTGSAIVAADDV